MGRNQLLFLSVLFLSKIALAGSASSGGGYSVVCYDADGQIESAQLLDLYEVEAEGHTLRTPIYDIDREYAVFVKMLRDVVGDPRPVGAEDLKQFYSDIKRYFIFSPPGVDVEGADDVGDAPEIPERCELEPVAIYRDKTSLIEVNSDIWNAMDSINKVALFAHEIFGTEYRLAGEKTTKIARKVVSTMFIENTPPSQNGGLPKQYLDCSGYRRGSDEGTTHFYVFSPENAPEKSVFQFTRLMGRSTYYPARIDIPVPVNNTDLEIRDEHEELARYVTDPHARLHDSFPMSKGAFIGYKISVRYSFSQPFNIELVSPKGKMVDHASFISCKNINLEGGEG